MQNTIHFLGTLVQAAPGFGKFNHQNWRAKHSLRSAVELELSSLPHESLHTSGLLDDIPISQRDKSNSRSLGASTITSQDNISTFGESRNLVCQTMVIITTILQKIAIELELLSDDSESIAQSEYLFRLYLQLLSIPKANLLSLINGFVFISNNAGFDQDISQHETHMAQKYATATFDAEIKELGIMKKALRWDLDQCDRSTLKSPTTILHHYHNDVNLHQHQTGPISSKYFPTVIDVPSKDSFSFGL
eukprot:CAMPEP_0203659086 /NCGR_PEP_ID=MMETSP0088-20131115/50576_1 /ASSEMBLY_ACC=CAM_ASM_001087 /TAXON_ID=426623 /ORGANISM="Chaetoceros affinis, Strain CCMP159" /LENGTH=247 /DNA_ID=CAMNT_0050520983 /DNA_START=219 /DNA_END=962 /DNA_ORIENTATION=-